MLKCVLLMIVLVCAQTNAATRTIYVAPGGNDAWSGTLPEANADGADGPVATIQKALELAREREQDAGAEVLIRGGTYYLSSTVTLGTDDSGTRLAAYPDESPRLVAGARVTGWQPWKGEIWQCDLNALGLEDPAFRELYCNGQRMILARYPNLDPEAPIAGGWLYVEAPLTKDDNQDFLAYEGDLKAWEDLSQAEVFEFHNYNYYNTIVGVKSVDPATREVRLATATYGVFAGDGAERYYFQNILEELDSPGEWYVDRESSTLYFWPPVPIDEATVEVPVHDFGVQIQSGAQNITVRGLTIEGARRTGVQVEEADNCLIAGNTVRNCGVGTQIGGWGTWENCCGIGLFGGTNNGAVGNDISQVGGHGVKLTGGDWRTLVPAGNYADNNYIHHTGLDWKQGCGARVEGVGNRFSRNTVHDIPRMGVIFGGSDHVIELNHMHHLNTETCDTGATYTGGRSGVSPWGCTVRYNYIHDVIGFGRKGKEWASPHYSWGIYLDDFASGVDVIGNIVVGTVRGGVHVHSGSHNRIENNILVGAELQQVEFNGWEKGWTAWTSRADEITRNWEERQQLPAWEKFPRLFEKHPDDWVLMSGNVIQRNVIVATGGSAGIYRWARLPLELTTFDDNVLWAGGGSIRTGAGSIVAKAVGPEICPNPGFEDGAPGEMPTSWGWYARPGEAIAAVADDQVKRSGARSLKVTCAPPDDPDGQFSFAMMKTPNIPIQPGKSYRIAAWMRADREGIPVNLVAQSWRGGQHHWARETSTNLGTDWRLLQLGVHVPGPDELGFIPTMTDFYIRLDFRAEDGTCWVDDVSLREAEPVDEWKGWQERGLDVHSVIADPLFVDPEKGDYRLRPDSPAFKLGFEPIPVEKIGCYEDPQRASWPIPDEYPWR